MREVMPEREKGDAAKIEDAGVKKENKKRKVGMRTINRIIANMNPSSIPNDPSIKKIKPTATKDMQAAKYNLPEYGTTDLVLQETCLPKEAGE